mgnify:CR=1
MNKSDLQYCLLLHIIAGSKIQTCVPSPSFLVNPCALQLNIDPLDVQIVIILLF